MTPDHAREITVVQLADETIDQLATRVADLLADRDRSAQQDAGAGPAGLLSAADVSRWWAVERGWVYQHADELGAIRLGTGRRPRLRFDPERVRRAMGDPVADARPRRSRRASKPDTAGSCTSASDSHELLPIHGEQSYRR